MATWDIINPPDDDKTNYPRGHGAQDIREAKTLLQAALTTDGIFPGIDASNPVFLHKFPSGTTAGRPAAGNAGRWYYNSDTHTIQRDTGAAWENITAAADLIPTGKKIVFYNSIAPTGWTQDTTNTDCFLRAVVGAGGGSGGVDSVASPPTHDHGALSGAPSNSLAHTHGSGGGSFGATSNPSGVDVVTSLTVGSSDALSHTHSVSAIAEFTPKYLDVIVCYR